MPHNPSTLREAVRQALKTYFSQLEGDPAVNVYEMVLNEVELPLLETVLQETQGNQSKAAEWLGISRNTLRKLMEKYEIEFTRSQTRIDQRLGQVEPH